MTALNRSDLESLAKSWVSGTAYEDPVSTCIAADTLAHAVLELLEVSDAARQEALDVYAEREKMRAELKELNKKYHLELMANADVKEELTVLQAAHTELQSGYAEVVEENLVLRRKVQVALAAGDAMPVIEDTEESEVAL